MAIPIINVNYLAVFVSAIVSMILGGLWYSPLFFGNAWMKASGMKQKDMEKAKQRGMGKLYFAAFIGTLVMSFVMSLFVRFLTATTFFEGMQTGFWIWLGFIVPVLLGSILWENKPIRYYLINVCYQLISLALIGGILAVWR